MEELKERGNKEDQREDGWKAQRNGPVSTFNKEKGPWAKR